MLHTLAEAVRGALAQRGLDAVWWGAAILDAWPHVVGTRYAERAQPILERSDLLDKGLLVVGVANSAWMQELSFLDVGARLNDALGRRLIRQVRFELRGGRRR